MKYTGSKGRLYVSGNEVAEVESWTLDGDKLTNDAITDERQSGSLREAVKRNLGLTKKTPEFNCIKSTCNHKENTFGKIQEHVYLEHGEHVSESAYGLLMSEKPIEINFSGNVIGDFDFNGLFDELRGRHYNLSIIDPPWDFDK